MTAKAKVKTGERYETRFTTGPAVIVTVEKIQGGQVWLAKPGGFLIGGGRILTGPQFFAELKAGRILPVR